jgi:beta-glucuronidase
VIGLNDYYGWYPSEPRIGDLSGALDRMHACEPHKAIIVTEFGAEANRGGSLAEKGTYAFQRRFADTYLRVFASRPWLSGALWFALQDFRVHPGWGGGDPRPDPPWNEKGLLSRTGTPKPAFAAVARSFRATPLYPR